MAKFPEDNTVDVTKGLGFMVNELIERGPPLQLAVELLHHVDLAHAVIGRQQCCQRRSEVARLFPGDGREYSH